MAAVQYAWSRNVLEHHIATQLHRREGEAVSNFAAQLPAPDFDLAVPGRARGLHLSSATVNARRLRW